MTPSDHYTLPVPLTRRTKREHELAGRRVHCTMSYQTYQLLRKLAISAETSFGGAVELAVLEGIKSFGLKPDRDWLIVGDPRMIASRKPGRKLPQRKRQ